MTSRRSKDHAEATVEAALLSLPNAELIAALHDIHQDLLLHGDDRVRRAAATEKLGALIVATQQAAIAEREGLKEVERRLLAAVRKAAGNG